jgi:hypothetical protein
MRDIIKALTHAKQHADMYAFIGRERPMLVNKRGPLWTDRIELRPERSESRDHRTTRVSLPVVSRLATVKADLVPSCVVARTATANLPAVEAEGAASEVPSLF